MKTALITGAATGIGLAATQKLAKEGWFVFATAMPEQSTANLRQAVALEQIIEVDLTQSQSVQTLIDIIRQHGRLDAVISNAGIAIPGPIEEVSMEDLKRQFEVNVFAPIHLVRAFLPLLRKSHGRLIFIGAGQGRVALPFGGPYGGSKAALAALTDALRSEVAQMNISVSLIEPGAVKTPILKVAQARSEALLANMSSAARNYYEKPFKKVLKASEKAFQSAAAPEKIADLIYTILTVRRPKPRYLFGKEAVALALIAVLPTRWRAALILKIIK